MQNRDWIKMNALDFGFGAASFEARVASAISDGKIELRLDSSSGILIGACSVIGTGGWQTRTIKSCSVTGATGVRDLYPKSTGDGNFLFNLNWWRFYNEKK